MLRVNDNGERLFAFRRGNGALWVVEEELRGDWSKKSKGENAETVNVALASRRKTDILRLRPHKVPDGIQLGLAISPGSGLQGSSLYARAAFYSWGHLLRLAACDLLDVETRELDVAIRPVRSDDKVSYEVVLMDTLENGSGYCRHLSEPEELRKLLAAVTNLDQDCWVARLAKGEHAERCDGSCYDCLRDYSNADVHSVLDWRLALDLSQLAADAGADLSVKNDRWAGLVPRAEKVLQEVARGRTLRMVHPLDGGFDSGNDRCNLFDAIRRPGMFATHRRSE